MTQHHQPTSDTEDKPVSDSQARHIGRTDEAAARIWKGGRTKMQLLKEDPGYKQALHEFWTVRAAMLALLATLLRLVKVITVRAIGTFVAQDYFTEENQPDGIKFWLGDNFKKYFLTKVEQPILRQKLRVFVLLQKALDETILQALGGPKQAAIGLAQMYEMIKAQVNGQAGDLLVNGAANIFYIEDTSGKLWAVYCHWNAAYGLWNVLAHSVSHPHEWYDGFQVFSR
ncbi:hypothetical protein HY523_02545 [Candidatus Berkelbacteria bacterium]|nr:hypothetical protein [Candidatus Berkelbacteria bacterium]